MKPKILSWNVCGLNEANKRLRIKNLLLEWKVDIVYLQETKMKIISISIVRSLRSCFCVDWVFLPSVAASGGVLVMWDRRVVDKMKEFIREHTVACSFRNVEDNFR